MEGVFLLSFPPPFPSIPLSSPSLSLPSLTPFLSFPSPSFSFPLLPLLPFPSCPLPLEVGPLKPARGSEERCKLPQRGGQNKFGALCQKATGGQCWNYGGQEGPASQCNCRHNKREKNRRQGRRSAPPPQYRPAIRSETRAIKAGAAQR